MLNSISFRGIEGNNLYQNKALNGTDFKDVHLEKYKNFESLEGHFQNGSGFSLASYDDGTYLLQISDIKQNNMPSAYFSFDSKGNLKYANAVVPGSPFSKTVFDAEA